MSYDAERIRGYLTDILQSPPVTVGEFNVWIETQVTQRVPMGFVTITGGEPSRDYHVKVKKKKEDPMMASFYSYRDALNAMALLIRTLEIAQGIELPEIKGV
jgi:hypothetical protein